MSIIPGNTGVPVSFPDGFATGAGSLSAPAYTSTSFTTTGLYFPGVGQIAYAAAGTQAAVYSSTGLSISVAGTVSAPSFRFSDTATGFYRPAANQFALASNGVQSWLVDASGNHTIGTGGSNVINGNLNISGTLTGGGLSAGLNEQPIKNYQKLYALSDVAPGTVLTLATPTTSLGGSLTAFYADSTSGSAAIGISATSALRGLNSYLTAVAAPASNNDTLRFVQFPGQALDAADIGKPISISFDIVGNTTDGDWDVVVVRYTAAGAYGSIISVAGNASSASISPSAKLPTGTTTFNGFFVPDSTTATDIYALRLRRLTTTAAQIRTDTLFMGNQPVRVGAAVTDTLSFTTNPTVAGLGTGSGTVTAKYARDVDKMIIDFTFIKDASAGTGTADVTAALNGVSIDTSKLSSAAINSVGSGSYRNASGQFIPLSVYTDGALFYFRIGGSANLRGADLPANTGNISFQAIVPIVGWSSNVTMADRAIESYASNPITADADSVVANSVSGLSGSRLPSVALTTTRSAAIRFPTPIQATDVLVIEIQSTPGATWVPVFANSVGSLAYVVQTTTEYGMFLAPSSSTDVLVYFTRYAYPGSGVYGAAGVAWSVLTTYMYRVRKVSSGAQIGGAISTANVVGRVDGVAPASGYIGELLESLNTTSVTGSTTLNTYTNIGATVTLTPGIWEVELLSTINIEGATGSGLTGVSGVMRITDSTVATVYRAATGVFANGTNPTAIGELTVKVRISVTTSTVIKGQFAAQANSGSPTITGLSANASATSPIVLRAVRIA